MGRKIANVKELKSILCYQVCTSCYKVRKGMKYLLKEDVSDVRILYLHPSFALYPSFTLSLRASRQWRGRNFE